MKAANLLIDDDGTVLLGDLGVAAPLQEEEHSQGKERSKPGQHTSFDHSVGSAPRRPKFGKRRSFVGTVPTFFRFPLTLGRADFIDPAMLDGAGTYLW